MKMTQIVGPIKKGTVTTISPPGDNNCTFVHIGLHVPKQWPVKDLKKEHSSPWLQVLGSSSKPGTDEHKYLLNEHNVLEFDGVEEEKFTIKALCDLPPETVIDIVYTTLEDE